MFQVSFMVAFRKFQGSFKGVSWKNEGCVKITFKWVSSVFERNSKGIQGSFKCVQACFNEVSRVFQESFRMFQGFQGRFRGVLRVLGGSRELQNI